MKSNLVLSCITIVFSLFFFVYSMYLPVPEDTEKIGPGGWPSTILILMLTLGIWLLVRTVLQMKKQSPVKFNEQDASSIEELKKSKLHSRSRNHFIVTVILVLYAIAVPTIGFLVSTFLLILSVAWLFGMKRKRNLVITSVCSSLFFIYLFTIILQLPLPRGLWLFREISLLFY